MRLDPNKLRLWLPVLAGTCAATFLVCCDQLSGKVRGAATPVVATAKAPAKDTPTKVSPSQDAVPAPIALATPAAPSATSPVAAAPVRSRPSLATLSKKPRRHRTAPAPMPAEDSVSASEPLPLQEVARTDSLPVHDSLPANEAVLAVAGADSAHPSQARDSLPVAVTPALPAPSQVQESFVPKVELPAATSTEEPARTSLALPPRGSDD